MLLQFGFSKTTAVAIHLAVMLVVSGYATYHLVYDNALIGTLSVIAGLALFLSAFNFARDKDFSLYTRLFVMAIAAALLATCYYHGIRGLIFFFPLITGLFYTFSHRKAIPLSIGLSILALALALNAADAITVGRFSIAMTLTVLFSMAFVILVDRQRAEIEREAGEDYLTGILNRRSFSTWLNREIPRATNSQNQLALLYIDLDDFKRINDVYGHSTGDLLLLAVSNRIKESIRASDRLGRWWHENQFARLAGDEFSLVLMNIEKAHHVENVVERLLSALETPFELDGLNLSINASIGIAMTGQDGNDFETLLHNADAAMYRAKRDGKRRYQFFNEEIASTIYLENSVEVALKEALEARDFQLTYMPIYDTQSLAVKGVEVLLRSTSEALTAIGTEQFIRVAEERGLIQQIDLLVLEMAIKRLKQTGSIPALGDLFFCINISALELMNRDFVQNVARILETESVDPARIELEITETSLVAENEQAITTLRSLKALGLRLSLDDFGTGYTAFNQLAAYPVDVLKIDRSFVNNIGRSDMAQRSMVNVILTLASLYDLNIVAEGVETEQQLHYLQQRKCHYVQGYYLSKPLNWEDFVEHVMSALDSPTGALGVSSDKKTS